MLKLRFLVTIAALTLMISAVGSVSAQQGQEGLSRGPSARPFTTPNNLVDHDFFDYDAQLWAPWDVTSLDGHIHANTGFYFEYDATYLSAPRPGVVPGNAPQGFHTGNSYHWGRLAKLGFMGTNDRGLSAEWLNQEGGSFLVGQGPFIPNPLMLRSEFNNFEINRNFRQGLSTGGYVEPFFGVRYTSLNDETIEDGSTGLFNRFLQRVDNSAIGAQLGSRYFNRYGRWQLQARGAVAAQYNSQRYFSTDTNNLTGVAFAQNTNENQTFVPSFDLGFQLSYNLTRDFSIRGGAMVNWLWEGMARVDGRTATANPNSFFGPGGFPTSVTLVEDYILAGFTFGVDWKR